MCTYAQFSHGQSHVHFSHGDLSSTYTTSTRTEMNIYFYKQYIMLHRCAFKARQVKQSLH